MRSLWIYPQSRRRLTLVSDATESSARFQTSIDDDLQSEYLSSHDYLDTSTPSIAAQNNFLQTDLCSKGKETTYCTWFKREGIEKDSKQIKEFATIQTVDSIQTSHLATVAFNEQIDYFPSLCETWMYAGCSKNIENTNDLNNIVCTVHDTNCLRAQPTIPVFSTDSRRTTGCIQPHCHLTLETGSVRLVFLCRQGRPT